MAPTVSSGSPVRRPEPDSTPEKPRALAALGKQQSAKNGWLARRMLVGDSCWPTVQMPAGHDGCWPTVQMPAGHDGCWPTSHMPTGNDDCWPAS